MVLKNIVLKNGGFPPINYCPELDPDKIAKTSKERFFSSTVKHNINIRQLLTDTSNKKPLIIVDNNNDDIEIANNL